jgi:hypothetical protein
MPLLLQIAVADSSYLGERCLDYASAYGWVTIEILSMVKRAHPLYSNNYTLLKVVWAHNLLRCARLTIDNISI